MKNDFIIGGLLILLIIGFFNPLLMTLVAIWSVALLSLAYIYYYCLGIRGKCTSSITAEWLAGTVILFVIMFLFNDVTTALNWTLFCSLCYGLGILDRQELLLGE